ncbi:hypothetical protein THITH_01760 [Thioalkalivibrio paradoxus ARh 1]|uniref:Uncharacterized protein n=1 Tax=Thioalkalivibrio paradoxus ARh 1 TaxID=713585 RepID=W0DS97_9GAMM|nr:hypothetical protein THITH_01760 [Thioalkalivibrio paradoxus ARh 1]
MAILNVPGVGAGIEAPARDPVARSFGFGIGLFTAAGVCGARALTGTDAVPDGLERNVGSGPVRAVGASSGRNCRIPAS